VYCYPTHPLLPGVISVTEHAAAPLVVEARKLSSHVNIFEIFIDKRRRKDYGNLDDLAKDMGENGQITAITIAPPNEEALSNPEYKGEPWMLVAGERRMLAAARLGWTTIRAIDREHLDPLKLRVLELAENLQRKDMEFVEVVRAKQEMFLMRQEQNPEITQAEVAKEIGETPANFSRDLAVASTIEQRPELAKASSKKAVLRAGKMIQHLEARVARDVISGGAGMAELAARMVTAEAGAWLRGQPTARFDAVISDPPYGIDHYKQGHKTASGEAGLSEYDDSEGVSLDVYTDMVPEMCRVTRETGWIILFMSEANYEFLAGLFKDCCLTHFEYRENRLNNVCRAHHGDTVLCSFRSPEEPRWIWYRPNSQNNPRFPEQNAKNVYEHILAFNRGMGKLLRPCDNVLVHDAEYGSRIHAMQKPLELGKDVISRVTLPGESFCDPFFGSGAFLRAGAQLARDFQGCDKNPALREVAMGYVSQDYDGMAPRVERGDSTSEEYLDTQLGELSDEDALEMEELEFEVE
jgi:ParB/RepB/Spo0J family partition protein